MKKSNHVSWMAAVLLLITTSLQAQVPTQVIQPNLLLLSTSKTSNLIFPYSIKSVDRGSADVLAQVVKAADSVLQLKAAKTYFPETNLTVITADGRLYSFVVAYSDCPRELNLRVGQPASSPVVPVPQSINEAVLKQTAPWVAREKAFLSVGDREQKMRLCLSGLYLASGVMWFVLDADNRSLISFQPDFIRFFIRDRKRAKRTAQQETELMPVQAEEPQAIGGRQKRRLVFGFRPVTIPRSQELIVQIGEQNGGRHLELQIKARVLLKARLLRTVQ